MDAYGNVDTPSCLQPLTGEREPPSEDDFTKMRTYKITVQVTVAWL